MGTLRGLDGHEVRPAISAEKALANAEASSGVGPPHHRCRMMGGR